RRVPFTHGPCGRGRAVTVELSGERAIEGPKEQEGVMSAITVATGRLPVAKRSAIAKEFNDGRAMIGRNLIAYKRVPQLLVFSTIQPIIFVLMFTYVFGGAIKGSLPPGTSYVDYLMPGIFVQTVVFGSLAAGV